jgi:hypothetical protein
MTLANRSGQRRNSGRQAALARGASIVSAHTVSQIISVVAMSTWIPV